MKIAAEQLINDLKDMIRDDIAYVKSLESMPLTALNYKTDENIWSILENLEHLNLYGDFYIPAIEEGLIGGEKYKPSPEFKSNWLGEYFAKSMLPKADGSIKKMNTFKSKNPKNGNLPLSIVDRFLKQQEVLLQLLDRARNSNMTKIKTRTTIGNWVKIRLGDTFRVVIYHNHRHMKQIQRIEIKKS